MTKGAFKQTTDFEKGEIIALHNAGYSLRHIAREMNRALYTVQEITCKYDEEGLTTRKPGSGRKRKTTPEQDRELFIAAKRDRRARVRDLQQEVGVTNVSESTVRRRIKESGEFSWEWTSKKPLVTEKQRKERLRIAKENVNEPVELWHEVIPSDESPFTLRYKFKSRVLRTKGEKYEPFAMTPTLKHDVKINVWGCFSYYGVGDLVVIEGLMDSDQYTDILKNHLIPSARRLFGDRKWIFLSDNDPKHTSKKTQRFMRENKITELQWPSQSPDLNPIENLWAYLDKKAKERKCKNKQELFACLQEEWRKIPLEYLRQLIDSMPRRCQAIIDSKGYPTKY